MRQSFITEDRLKGLTFRSISCLARFIYVGSDGALTTLLSFIVTASGATVPEIPGHQTLQQIGAV
eukprot:1078369-Amphidinium_carterae.2